MSSLIRNVIYDYDIQDAEGFIIQQMAVISYDLRWMVVCGEAKEIVHLYRSPAALQLPTEVVNKKIKRNLQNAVDRMWSRWEAL